MTRGDALDDRFLRFATSWEDMLANLERQMAEVRWCPPAVSIIARLINS